MAYRRNPLISQCSIKKVVRSHMTETVHHIKDILLCSDCELFFATRANTGVRVTGHYMSQVGTCRACKRIITDE